MTKKKMDSEGPVERFRQLHDGTAEARGDGVGVMGGVGDDDEERGGRAQCLDGNETVGHVRFRLAVLS
jgi:hypothetical protein